MDLQHELRTSVVKDLQVACVLRHVVMQRYVKTPQGGFSLLHCGLLCFGVNDTSYSVHRFHTINGLKD